MKISLIGKIIDIDFCKNDYISLNIENDEFIYKGLIIIKGDIFPTPKKNDLIEIQEIIFKYDDYYQLKFFIKGKLLHENTKNYLKNCKNKKKEIIDFTELNIFSSLKKYLNIKINYILIYLLFVNQVILIMIKKKI